ncbi:MAG: MafI family immunity protein [Halodesulfovibrio sp.]
MEEIEMAELIIRTVLGQVGDEFPDNTVLIVDDLIAHSEVGVALEILCSQIFEYNIELSDGHRARLKDAACLLKMSLSQLDGLSD